MADHTLYAPLQPEFRFSAPTHIDYVHIDPSKYTVAVLRLPKTASMQDVQHLMDVMGQMREALGLAQVVLVPEDTELTFEQFDGPVVPVVNGEPVTK